MQGEEISLAGAEGTQPKAGTHRGHQGNAPGTQLGASCDLPMHSVWDPKMLAGPPGSRCLVPIAAGKGRCNQVGWVSSGSGWGG